MFGATSLNVIVLKLELWVVWKSIFDNFPSRIKVSKW